MGNPEVYWMRAKEEAEKGIKDAEKLRGVARDILERELAIAQRWLDDSLKHEDIIRALGGDITHFAILGRRMRKVKMYETALSF